jgi:BRCA1-associated protein
MHADVEPFAASLRKALSETFVQIDNEWSQLGHFSGVEPHAPRLMCTHPHLTLIFLLNPNFLYLPPQLEGTTVTVALCTGWLLTVANAGDSGAVLDTGSSLVELTCSHRIQSNLEEQSRLRGAGQQLAPLGFHLQVYMYRLCGRAIWMLDAWGGAGRLTM